MVNVSQLVFMNLNKQVKNQTLSIIIDDNSVINQYQFLILKQQMLGKEIKKQNKNKKNPNLRILEILNQQNAVEKPSNKPKNVKNKNQTKPNIKGKKIDNKTILHQLKNHLDDFPVVLKNQKQIDRFVNNSTLTLAKQNQEYQYPFNRPNSSIPFRDTKKPKVDQQRRKKSRSISIHDINDSLQKQELNIKNLKKLSKINKRGFQSQLQLDQDKQNRYSQSRNSFAYQRSSFGGQRRSKIHNKSCNDQMFELRSNNKSKTPVSKTNKKNNLRLNQNYRQKNNFSCIERIEDKNTFSLEKDKKPKKKKSLNNEKRRYSVNLINAVKVNPLRNDKSKEFSKVPQTKKLKKPKKSSIGGDLDKAFKKKKQAEKQKKQEKERPRKSFTNEDHIKYLQNLKKKKLLIQKQISEEQENEYPVSKYVNLKKKKSKNEKPFNNILYKKLIENNSNSLIKSSLETSKKSSHERTIEFVERITELQQEGGASANKVQSNMLGQEGYSIQFNLNELREYQKLEGKKKYNKQKYRRQLYIQIHEEYPELNQEQIIFLASVIFIQRKWRSFQSYKNEKEKMKNKLSLNKEVEVQSEVSLSVKQKLSQKSSPVQSEKLEIIPVKSNPEPHSNNTQSNEGGNIKDPLLKIILQKKKKQLKKSSQEANNQSQNPLKKHKQYFQELQKQDIITESNNYFQQEEQIIQDNQKTKNDFMKFIKSKATQQQQIISSKSSIKEQFVSQKNFHNLDIKVKTQITEQSNSYNCEKEIFPPFELIHIQKKFLIADFEKNLEKLEQMYVNSNIDTNRFKLHKENLEKELEISVTQLKKNNKDIQKGYLKYIDCIKNIKLQVKKPKRKLRKVSSENGLMAKLYLKFFKVQSSNDSDSLKKLKRKLLIRKQYFQNRQEQQNLLTIGDQLTDRILRKQNQAFDIDMSEKFMIAEDENFEKMQQKQKKIVTTDFIQIKELPSQQKQKKPGNNIININEFLNRIKLKEDEQNDDEDEDKKFQASIKKQQNSIFITEEIFNQLVTEVQQQLFSNPIVLKKLASKLQKKKRKLPGLSSINYRISHYVDSFFSYIFENYFDDILKNFNTIIGFSPLNYLKILRDPEFSEPDEYIPMISNKIYIQYQPIYFASIELSEDQVKFENFLRAIVSIHNKALFQSIVIELQKIRPYGQQGLPYPWDNEPIYHRPKVTKEKFLKICEQVKSRIQSYVNQKCGIILQKYSIRNSDELQKLHDQKQDRLLSSIEQQMKEGEETKYQLNEELLQIKLRTEQFLFDLLIRECVTEVQRLFL